MPLSPLRLCFVIEGFAGISGGGERVLADVANGLARRGHAVEIVTHERASGPPFYPLDPQVRLTPLRRPQAARGALRRRAVDRARRLFDRLTYGRGAFPPPLDRLAWINRFGGFWRRLGRHLDASPPDVAIAFMPAAMTALALARPRRVPRRVASTHNLPEFSYESASRDNVNPAFRRATLASLPAFDAITVLLESHLAWYPEALRARAVVMPNPVAAPAAPADPAAREKLVMAVGRLSEVKRHEILIDAWARLAHRFPGWRVEIYGDGPRRAELQARIDEAGLGESLRLMGAVPGIEAVYARASVFAHPASVEGFPMAVCEALAAGLPVAGFADCAGLNALVADGVNGTLAPGGGDLAANFAGTLATLLSDEDLRRRLGAGGPPSMAPYAPDRVLDRWEALLRGVAERGAPPPDLGPA